MPDPANPQSLNRYSYVLNNPLRYIDPSGMLTEEEIESLGPGTLRGLLDDAVDPAFYRMLRVADWGDSVYLGFDNENYLYFDLVQGSGLVNTTAVISGEGHPELRNAWDVVDLATDVTILRNSGVKSRLNLYDGDSGKRRKGFKIQQANVAARTAELFAGIALATAGGVAILVGVVTLPVGGVGLAVGAAGGIATTAGWELARDAVHELSGGSMAIHLQ